MRQWEIRDFPFPSPAQPHPFVVISPDLIAANDDITQANALLCVSVRGDYKPKPRDVRLNGSDGLDGPTVVRCHFVHGLAKEHFGPVRGLVTAVRRRAIVKTINLSFGFQNA